MESKYFVLKPRGNSVYAKASRAAMMVYANAIKNEDVELYDELIWLVSSETNIPEDIIGKLYEPPNDKSFLVKKVKFDDKNQEVFVSENGYDWHVFNVENMEMSWK